MIDPLARPDKSDLVRYVILRRLLHRLIFQIRVNDWLTDRDRGAHRCHRNGSCRGLAANMQMRHDVVQYLRDIELAVAAYVDLPVRTVDWAN